MSGYQMNTPATIALEKLNPGSTCYEYYAQKLMGMTAEECILLAIALDFHKGNRRSPLVNPIAEVATVEEESGAMSFVRILLVVQGGADNATTRNSNRSRLSLS